MKAARIRILSLVAAATVLVGCSGADAPEPEPSIDVQTTNATVSLESSLIDVTVARAAPGFFDSLEVEPRLGRSFLESDVAPGAPAVAVLNHSFWSSHLDESPAAIGRQIAVDGEPTTIVGVLPEGFQAEGPDIWLPAHSPDSP